MKQHKNHVDNLHQHQETFHENLVCSRRLVLLTLTILKSLHVKYYSLAVLIHHKTTSVILETIPSLVKLVLI